MTIDTSTIEGYAEMTADEKVAALEGLNLPDTASSGDGDTAAVERYKKLLDKANSEAAEHKRKYNAKLSEDELQKEQAREQFENMKTELENYRKKSQVSEFKSSYLAQGYTEELAAETATAMADGDMATVFKNGQLHLTEFSKQLKADAMKNVPHPPSGDSAATVDYAKELEKAQETGDHVRAAYLTRLAYEQNNK